ncbi:AraC family transcriptional regulator [Chitinophaga japonensis]|uniref:AraC-like DNA-binding protein n=1 Tax=Chitinophaga japonensis TaxID=104662 RepID=A0A562T669_CHIJA|nr:AraC family transcriptional regulator [Chitinophaga japonensis]TWI88744.1 AraC-like DNA-binding protein [Chitinophaga japonensis]
MAKSKIPVYDIYGIIPGHTQQDLLLSRFAPYVREHRHLHTQHGHSFYHLVLFTKGAGEHTIDFDRFTVQPYQVYFMAPGQVHSWHFNGDMEGYLVHFSPAFFQSFLADQHYLDRFGFFRGISKEAVLQIPAAMRKDAVALFENMLAELEQPREGGLDMIRMYLLQFFMQVERCCGNAEKQQVPRQKQLLLANFQQLINKHYNTIRLPREYAELLYITPNHLNALCQDLVGRTAGEMIRDRVLLEAKRLLVNEALTITEIAYALNFQDNSYFNRFFRKNTGMTPEAFRKQIHH